MANWSTTSLFRQLGLSLGLALGLSPRLVPGAFWPLCFRPFVRFRVVVVVVAVGRRHIVILMIYSLADGSLNLVILIILSFV